MVQGSLGENSGAGIDGSIENLPVQSFEYPLGWVVAFGATGSTAAFRTAKITRPAERAPIVLSFDEIGSFFKL